MKTDKWLYLCNLGGHHITSKLEDGCEDECELDVTSLSSESGCDRKITTKHFNVFNLSVVIIWSWKKYNYGD